MHKKIWGWNALNQLFKPVENRKEEG